ncbi:MAG: hydrogen peroxide-inducible genes activator [Flavobacteriales bacterium]|nr:hydrogen peroxide-inducible genes activator [Flavobacteriales bacterium]
MQQLQYVVALDDHHHFVRAAAACFVTQPTLTMQVRKLEEELRVSLFDRRVQPVRPTAIGAHLIAQSRVVLREAAQLNALIGELHSGIGGLYRVGVIPTLAPYLVPLFLPGFAKAHPDVKLVIDERKTSRIIKGLRRGEIDLGILVTPVDLPDIEEVALFREPFLAYLPEGHPLRKRRRVQRSDLREQALWVLSEGHCFREQTLSLCDRPSAGGHDNVLYESGSIETLKQLVRSGSGMTLVPELSVTPDDPHVRRFNPPEPVCEVSLVMRRPFVRRKLIDAFAAAIHASLPEHLCGGSLRAGRALPIAR